MRNIVFLGVGGTGLSAIAGLLNELGFSNIVGIDSNKSEITKKLSDQGLEIIIGHGKYKPNKLDLIIYSDIEAIKNGPEMISFLSLERGLKWRPPLSYSQFIGEISKWFKTIAIAGSKGKSSTTAMMIYAMNKSVDSFGLGIVGGLLPDFDNKNYVLNNKYKQEIKDVFSYFLTGKGVLDYNSVKKFWFVIEACEYKEHFLLYNIDYSIITNFYYDHFDYFKNYEQYLDVYLKLIKNTKKRVFMIGSEGEIRNNKLNLFSDKKIGNKWIASCLAMTKCVFVEKKKFDFNNIFGDHWNTNASLVNGLLEQDRSCFENKELLENSSINKESLIRPVLDSVFKDFHGVWRRMEKIGENQHGVSIYSDYGHTAQSVGVGIKSLRVKFPNDKLLIIFQPHQMRRILSQWEEFKIITNDELKITNFELIIYKLYTAREKLTDFDFSQYYFLGKNSFESFDEIGELFAKDCGGGYEVDIDNIIKKIQTFGEGKIVLFTAGDLDYDIRERL